jgi:hypothetical protein
MHKNDRADKGSMIGIARFRACQATEDSCHVKVCRLAVLANRSMSRPDALCLIIRKSFGRYDFRTQ